MSRQMSCWQTVPELWNFLGRPLWMVEVFPQRQPHLDPDGSAHMAEVCLSCSSDKVILINTNNSCVQAQLLPFKEAQNKMDLPQLLETLNYNQLSLVSLLPFKKNPKFICILLAFKPPTGEAVPQSELSKPWSRSRQRLPWRTPQGMGEKTNTRAKEGMFPNTLIAIEH